MHNNVWDTLCDTPLQTELETKKKKKEKDCDKGTAGDEMQVRTSVTLEGKILQLQF